MKELLKILIIYLTRFFTRALFIFPVKKNRVSFISFGGRSFTCCPKYIYNELVNSYGNKLEYIWFFRNPDTVIIDNPDNTSVKKIKFLSFKFFYYLATSKYIISNYSMITRPPLRKKQIYINTWHGGGAYKKVGLHAEVKARKRTDITFNLLAKDTTWFVSSCNIFTNVMSKDMRMPVSKFLNIGMPRNDIFFTDYTNIANKVRLYYSIPSDKKILLYAPTYRGEPGSFSENVQLDINKAINALESKFGSEFICLYRGHYYIHDKVLDNTINASDYPDMQELLCAADILVTDFSSSMWDFSLTKKPCFLFAPDLAEYGSSREFYTEPEKWGFPIALTNEEFSQNIADFDQIKYEKNLDFSHSYFGSFEKGTATKQFIEKIFNNS